MLVSSESKTATVGWSPAVSGCPAPLLAAATASGALDASFSTETTLDIFDPFVDDSDSPHRKTFKRLGSVTSNARFNRIAWGPGPDLVKRPMGIIAGGLESGDMALWDPRIILDNASKGGSPADPLVMKPFKHKGAVRGLDFNPVDPKFLASGAADGELLIWDLTNPTKPYNPGARSNRLDDVTAVAWNRMYHYILASASNNGNTVIWDLRNRNEIAAFSHPGGRKQISSISWNPDSPTQIVTASDDDANPVILVWDLRNSRAPEKVLSGHTQGILHVSWCPKDSDLLLSCGKDNRTIVWNMSTSSVIGDLHHSSNWSFEASWCHRNPDLVAVAGFDGKISIHSLQASPAGDASTDSSHNAAARTAQQVALATNPHEFITQGGFGGQGGLQPQDSFVADTKFTLPFAPKWLRRPVGATWGFGNRLVRFTNGTHAEGGSAKRLVAMQSVVSEPAFAARATLLEKVAAVGTTRVEEFVAYCQAMAAPDNAATLSEKDREVWRFLGVMFETGSREQVLQFLGFDKADVAGTSKLATLLAKLMVSTEPEPATSQDDVQAAVTYQSGDGVEGEADDFALIASQNKASTTASKPSSPAAPFKLYSQAAGDEADTDALIMKALVLGNFETAVRVCFGANRLSDALMFAVCGGQELLNFAQQEYFKRLKSEKSYIRVLHNVVQGDLHDIVLNAQIDGSDVDWKDLLALICTYGKTEDLSLLFSTLGHRLEAVATAPTISTSLKTVDWKGREEKKFGAVLCYLVAGDLSKVLQIWAVREAEEEKLLKTVKNAKNILTSRQSSHSLALQSLIEKVQVFRQAIEFVDVDLASVSDENSTNYTLEALYQRYVDYAQVAASQGLVSVAWKTLQLVPDSFKSSKVDSVALDLLKDRIYKSGLVRDNGAHQPRSPFEVVDLLRPAQVSAPAPVVQQGYFGQGYQNPSSNYGAAAPPVSGSYPSAGSQNSYGGAHAGYGGYPAHSGHEHGQASGYGFQNGYGQSQAGYSHPAPPPARGFAAPPPPSAYPPVARGYSGSGSTFQAPPPPAGNGGYQAPNTYGQYGGVPAPIPPPPTGSGLYGGAASVVPPPPPAGTGYQAQPPMAARSVSHANTFAAPQPVQPSANYGSYPGSVPPPQPSASVPPQQPAAPVETGPKRHPSGDRSHMKPAHLPIVNGLDAVIKVCKESRINPQQKREWEDTEKKVLNLFDQINNGEVAEDICGKLLVLVKALQGNEYSAAHKLQVELMTTRFASTSSWIVGVKRVIDTLERAELDRQQAHAPPPPGTSAPYSSPYGQTAVPPPKATTLPPPPASAMPYGGSAPQTHSIPPPPTAKAAPYGAGNPLSPQAAASNAYMTNAPSNMPPPPTAAASPYSSNPMSPRGAAPNAYGAPMPPPAARNAYGAPPPAPTNQYGAPPPPTASAPYAGGQGSRFPPPPAGASYGNAPPQATYNQALPSPAANPYGGAAGVPPPPPASSNPYGGRY